MSVDIKKFTKWLTDRGGEILPTTSEYEAIRFKGRQVGVLYKSGKTSNGYTHETIIAFRNNTKWKGQPVKMRRKSYRKEKEQLLDRDGDKCFMCLEVMEDDITVEHLIPLSSGGKNELSNMVLCHEKCNKELSNKPINEKIELVIATRIINKNK